MPAFSRAESKLQAIATRIRRAKIQAKQGHPDMKLKHAGEVRDAVKGDYTQLIKRITEDTQKAQLRVETFTRKLHEKST